MSSPVLFEVRRCGLPFAAVLFVLFLLGRAEAGQVVASPEGTVTTYVSDKGPLVFAPRAARAQKVIFDTSDKQLIYAPDTPFRRFFDSRANDFDPAQLEYAKTTILGDIVAQLRSREYIRDMVGRVIDSYRQDAISGASFSEKWAYETSSAIKANQDLTKAESQGTVDDASQVALETALDALAQLQKSHPHPKKALEAAKALQTIQVAQSEIKNGLASKGVREKITKAIADVAEAVAGGDASEAARQLWRRQRAELLRDMIYLRLAQENYPEMADSEIDTFIENLGVGNDVWTLATVGATNNAAGIQAMTIELRQRLKQRDWLNQVVEAAISKRSDLFKKAGSPVAGLLEAGAVFDKFVRNNLASATLTAAVRNDAFTLWRAFLAHANTPLTNGTGRFLLQPRDDSDHALPAGDLRIFGDDLRKKLLEPDTVTGQRRNMEQMKELLAKLFVQLPFSANLCPEFGTGRTPAELRALWLPKLTNDFLLKSAHSGYATALAGSDLPQTTNAVLKLAVTLGTTISNLNVSQLADDRIETATFFAALSNRVAGILIPEIKASGKAQSLGELLQESLAGVVIPLNTDRARRRFIAEFESVFNGWLELLGSDDPILTALLKAESIHFATPDLRRKAVLEVPGRYFAEVAKEGSNPLSVFKQVIADPALSYLFGNGPSSPQAIEAFSREFYSAFHNPRILNAATEAEREADYDYWWLTFYPKAIPLGMNKLEGDSIIEVAFPDSVVPDVQYHRWLQDSSLGGWRDGGERKRKVYTHRSEESLPGWQGKDLPGGLPADLRLRNATALLRDTLTVLEASELKARFTEVRPVMLHALDAFTTPRESEDQRYWKGVRILCEEVFPEDKDWLSYLAALADEGGITNDVLRIDRSLSLDVSILKPQTNLVDRILKSLRYQVGTEGKEKTAILARKLVERLSHGNPQSAQERSFVWEQLDTQLDDIEAKLQASLKRIAQELKASGFKDPRDSGQWERSLSSRFEGAHKDLFKAKTDSLALKANCVILKTNYVIETNCLVLKTNCVLLKTHCLPFDSHCLNAIKDSLQEGLFTSLEKTGTVTDAKSARAWRSAEENLQHMLADQLQIAFDQTTAQLTGKAEKDSVPESRYALSVRDLMRSFAISFYLKQPVNVQAMNNLRAELKRVDFSSLHVLFSVLAVTETKARLPEKVNLFAWAGAQGLMLFSTPVDELKQSPLLEHVIKYFNNSEPKRGDYITNFDGIPIECLKAMQAEADLYSLILNAYFSKYPDVPSKQSIRDSYFENGKERLRSLLYNWLDHYGIFFDYPFSPPLVQRLGAESVLSPKSQALLYRIITKQTKGKPLTATCYREALANAVNDAFTNMANLSLVAELDEKLFDDYYASIWQMAAVIEETERHVIPYPAIRKEDFRSFRSWARPVYQRGIQIVEMLPSSRDDLVSMSINEGGVVARLAAQADASAAYDMNNLKMAQRYASITGNSVDKLLKRREASLTNGLGTATEALSEASSGRSRQVVRELSEIGKSASSQGYSLGATANGSAYGRARAALAYARRREYLDAAITAAGRGDNFAKWVVRKSDLRSELAKQGGKKLVAAAHNGFPNGDQPFHLLVKIPHTAARQDWNGRSYIFFNSTYVATKKVSAWRIGGFPGLVAKLPLVAINPHWWNDIEEGLVGTQFPFMWDVTQSSQQTTLLREPNFLGGEIWLDDTDKVKYSEIQELLTAEDTFVRVTREAQSRDLGQVMSEIEKESDQFGEKIRGDMSNRMKRLDATMNEESGAVSNRVVRLEKELNEMKARLNSANVAGTGTNATPGAQ